MRKANYFILTGGPGMGKTAIIDVLRLKGHTCVQETGREIIRQQVSNGGNALPWDNRSEFARLMFLQSVQDFEQHNNITGPVFFDRGIADTVGYLNLCGLPVPEEMLHTASTLRFNRQVFITPPWKEIFHADAERKQSFDEAVRTYNTMQEVYTQLGYTLLILPTSTVAERVAFILQAINPA